MMTRDRANRSVDWTSLIAMRPGKLKKLSFFQFFALLIHHFNCFLITNFDIFIGYSVPHGQLGYLGSIMCCDMLNFYSQFRNFHQFIF